MQQELKQTKKQVELDPGDFSGESVAGLVKQEGWQGLIPGWSPSLASFPLCAEGPLTSSPGITVPSSRMKEKAQIPELLCHSTDTSPPP
jgi:hypothetical protein